MLPMPMFLASAEGGFNPLVFDPAATALTIITFLALLFILGKFAWGPILAAIEQREKRIEDAITGAETDRKEAERLLAEYKRTVADVEGEMAALREKGRTEAEAIRADIRAKAESEANALSEKARREIEQAKMQAVSELRREAVELGLAVATRVVGKSLDGADQRRLAQEVVGKVAAAGKN